MAESEKKRRSGRARDDGEETSGKQPPSASDASEKLQQPWLPLFWLLVPLIASVAYGLATRGH